MHDFRIFDAFIMESHSRRFVSARPVDDPIAVQEISFTFVHQRCVCVQNAIGKCNQILNFEKDFEKKYTKIIAAVVRQTDVSGTSRYAHYRTVSISFGHYNITKRKMIVKNVHHCQKEIAIFPKMS